MSRDLSLGLILGCLLVLLLETPAVVRELELDLRGPYGGWEGFGEVHAAERVVLEEPQEPALRRPVVATPEALASVALALPISGSFPLERGR